ncbi:MAG: thioesterase family protein [Afipia sp.]|nr:thioesterase family protein [Afipia sp.]
MKPTLTAGLTHRLSYRVPENRTVPHLFPESREFQGMPEVFATGYMVGLMEWACMEMIRPHLEEGEGTLGTMIDVSHTAATPPGLTITVDVECTEMAGKLMRFNLRAHDGVDVIGEGRHERYAVMWDKFNARVASKAANAGVTA